MLAIDPSVMRALACGRGEIEQPPLELVLFSRLDGRAVSAALRECEEEIGVRHGLEVESGVEPLYAPGEWYWVRTGSGVLIRADESDDIQRAFGWLIEGLERRGVGGTLRVWEQRPGPELPSHAPALFLQASIRGERFRQGRRRFAWRTNEFDFTAFLASAVAWCSELGDQAEVSLEVGPFAPLVLAGSEDVVDRLIEASADGRRAQFNVIGHDAFRSVVLHRGRGRVVLIAGQGVDTRGWWRPPLNEMLGVLRHNAERLVYGSVRRGWDIHTALGTARPTDWPAPPPGPELPGSPSGAFDDEIVPDAFGVQLLGPNLRARLRLGPKWQQERCGDALLVVACDLDAWFDAPLVAQPGSADSWPDARDHPVPPILSAAREDISALIDPKEPHETGRVEPKTH